MPCGYKYSVSAMCKVLQVSRSTYYYEFKAKKDDSQLVADIVEIFRPSRNNYGTRKIKHEFKKMGQQVSRRRICHIMKQVGLVSDYTIAQFKPHSVKCNEDKIENIVDRHFDKQSYLNVVVSDLTYVRVGNCWHYLCVLVYLFNREMIEYSSGLNKDAELVKKAFLRYKRI